MPPPFFFGDGQSQIHEEGNRFLQYCRGDSVPLICGLHGSRGHRSVGESVLQRRLIHGEGMHRALTGMWFGTDLSSVTAQRSPQDLRAMSATVPSKGFGVFSCAQ